MKKRHIISRTLFWVLLLGLLLTAACAQASAFGDWYAQVKEEAFKADHVLGPGGDIMNDKYVYVRWYTVIMPGETIAILPESDEVGYGIQGGYIMTWGVNLWQLDDPVLNTDYLKTSKPEKDGLTALETRTLTVPLQDRAIAYPDDPISKLIGPREITYVSLYRNDTGLPIVINGARGGEFGSKETTDLTGMNKDDKVNYQGHYTLSNKPTLYLAEPYYDLTVVSATVQTRDTDFSRVEWREDPAKYSTRVYVENKDREYVFSAPTLPGSWCEKLESKDARIFRPQNGARTGDTFTYTFNVQDASREGRQTELALMLADVELNAAFMPGQTVRLDAQGGKIRGKESLLVDVCLGKIADFEMRLDDYVPVRKGYNFIGWYADPENPEESLIKDTRPSKSKEWHQKWAKGGNTDLYALWELKSLKGAEVKLSKSSFTYNGEVQKPTVKTINGKKMKLDTDYTIKWSNASSKAAGTYTMTIKGIGRYNGSVKVTYEIKKAANPMAAEGGTAAVEYEALKKKARTLKLSQVMTLTGTKGTVTFEKVSGNKNITVNPANGKVTVAKGMKKGTYSVKVKVTSSGGRNYKTKTLKVTFRIQVLKGEIPLGAFFPDAGTAFAGLFPD